MATIYGEVKGIVLLSENINGTTGNVALVSFEMPAYEDSADSGKLGAGGYDRGVATTDTLATMIQKQRRDGKTVTLPATTAGGGAILCNTGSQGGVEFFAGTFAVTSGSLTFNLTNSAGTEIDAASGVRDRPISILVAYTVA